MKINIAICDDEIHSLTKTKVLLEQYIVRQDKSFSVQGYTDSIAFLKAYQENPDIDILFLDIEMPGMDGLTLAKEIRKLNKKRTEIIFVTSYPKYMQSSFSVHPYHYLTKPISFDDLETLFNDLLSELDSHQLKKLHIVSAEGESLLDINDIIHISVVKGKKNILEYKTTNKTIIGRGNIQELSEQLKPYHFCTIYRDVLCNAAHIQYFSKGKVIFDNGEAYPVSRMYEKDIRTIFAHNVINFSS